MKIVRYIIMMVSLVASGVIFAIAGAFIGGKVLGSDDMGFGALGLAIGGALVGYLVGITAGVILIKKGYCLCTQ